MTATDPTLAGLLRAILDRPDDDTARRVYADYLDERHPAGADPHAELIRVQCDDCACKECVACGIRHDDFDRFLYVECDRRDSWRGSSVSPRDCHRCRLTVRANQLARLIDWRLSGGWSVSAETDWMRQPLANNSRRPSAVVRRGFVEEVRCSLASFLAVAPALFACQPVTRVTIADRKPWVQAVAPRLAGWWEAAPQHTDTDDTLPTELMAWLDLAPNRHDFGIAVRFQVGADRDRSVPPGGCVLFGTREAARNALDAACVATGRGLAGLMPIPPETSACSTPS